MAFNLAVFKTRALSALFFVIIMLGGLLWNQWSFLALFCVIHVGCWYEYSRLIDKIDPKFQQLNSIVRYLFMGLGFGLMFWMTDPLAYPIFGIMTVKSFGGYFFLFNAAILFVVLIVYRKKLYLDGMLYLIAGVLYISLSWALMLKLRGKVSARFQGDMGWILPVILIATIWINDTMAYLVGSFIGKRPLSAISPKKTWEGTIGGVVLAVLIVSYAGASIWDLPFRALVLISLIAAVMGTFGDLLESKLKRMAGVKDSGQMMPGHGGFLDRFDSLLLATPYVWIFADLFL
jgi:phosphatidate cytidylyltransferase